MDLGTTILDHFDRGLPLREIARRLGVKLGRVRAVVDGSRARPRSASSGLRDLQLRHELTSAYPDPARLGRGRTNVGRPHACSIGPDNAPLLPRGIYAHQEWVRLVTRLGRRPTAEDLDSAPNDLLR